MRGPSRMYTFTYELCMYCGNGYSPHMRWTSPGYNDKGIPDSGTVSKAYPKNPIPDLSS